MKANSTGGKQGQAKGATTCNLRSGVRKPQIKLHRVTKIPFSGNGADLRGPSDMKVYS